MTVRPTARAMNKPLLIAGIERRLLGLSFIISVVFAANANSGSGVSPTAIALAVGIFIATITAAKRLTRKDDRIFQIALSVWKQKPVYDPLVRKVKQ
jgi:type IV secretory pathway TrbD component